jgi:hypothetical protein
VPHCYGRVPPAATPGGDDMCEVGTHPPLRICRETTPPWAEPGDKEALVGAKRAEIERVLKRWGAQEYVLEGQAAVSDSDTEMEDDDGLVDLTSSD